MIEKKRLQEQVASHTYKKRPEVREVQQTLQRVVTIPEVNPLESWNEFSSRRKQLSQERERPRKYVGPVARTYAQTGTYAPSGQMRGVRKPLAGYGTRVPQRSGRLAYRRGLIWKILGVLAGGVLVMLAGNFAFAGNAFRIEQITVAGTHNDGLIRSIQRMGMQGQNIFLLNVPALSERISALPLVDSVTLSKQLPNQLVVSVNEREPLVVWSTQQGSYSVDAKGVIIAKLGQGADTSQIAMIIDGSSEGETKLAKGKMQPGQQLNQGDITFAAEIYKRLAMILGNNGFTLRYNGTIYANTTAESGSEGRRGSFIVKSEDGWLAYLGGAGDINPLENRLLELQQLLLLAKKQQLKVATIDLRYGLHPIYTLK